MAHYFICYVFLSFSAVPGSPPGTVKLNDTLYADRTEVTNLDWRECLHWINKTYGDTSQQYLSMLPDCTCWNIHGVDFEEYLRHPKYQNFPVVCISHEQALEYCKWRTNIVNENIYKKNKKNKKSKNLDFSKIYYPSVLTYRLPSTAEWETLAAMAVAENSIFSASMPGTTDIAKNDKLGFAHIAGNVSEMTAEKGLAKGGNFSRKIQDFDIMNCINYDKPYNWLGFRCVCEPNK